MLSQLEQREAMDYVRRLANELRNQKPVNWGPKLPREYDLTNGEFDWPNRPVESEETEEEE